MKLWEKVQKALHAKDCKAVDEVVAEAEAAIRKAIAQ